MAASAGNNAHGRGKTVPEILALAFGAVYLLVGIVGFFVTGFDNFAGNEQHEMLLGLFMINPLHNIAHILIGVAGLLLAPHAGRRTHLRLAARRSATAPLFVYGLIAVGEDWDFLNINAADNVLHIATALVGLVIALLPVRTAVDAARPRADRPAPPARESRVPSSLRGRRDPARAVFRAGPGGSTLDCTADSRATARPPGPRGGRDGRRSGPALPGRRPRARRPRAWPPC